MKVHSMRFPYCDCRNNKGNLDLQRAGGGYLKMRITKIDDKDLCIHCGHEALITVKPWTVAPTCTKKNRDQGKKVY